jgi:hypothetical protein
MEFKYQLRMAFLGGGVDFAELPCGKWEWDSLEELGDNAEYLFKYGADRRAVVCYITKAWGDGEEVDMDYEIIWVGHYKFEIVSDSDSDSDGEEEESNGEVYYILSNYNLTQVLCEPSVEEYEEESRIVVNGRTEITYKKIGSDEGGNSDDE